MKLEKLQEMLRTDDPFHPMDDMDWMTWSGANPGTYISHDEVGHRVIFAEPTGDIGILCVGADYEGEDEFNFRLLEPLEGFDDIATRKNKAYHQEVEARH